MAVRVRLDRPIRIESPNFTTEAGEEVVSSWSTVVTTWAERKDVSNDQKEEVEAMRLVSSDYTHWIIAYPPADKRPTTLMRLIEIDGGAIYDIENVAEHEKAIKEYLILVCKQKQQR